MSTWIPVTLICEAEALEAANRLAHIIDPDVGGAFTFGDFAFSADGNEPATHYATESMMAPDYVGLVQAGDATTIEYALGVLAVEYGREPPSTEDCLLFAQHVTIYPERHLDRKSTRLNSSHTDISRMPSSA